MKIRILFTLMALGLVSTVASGSGQNVMYTVGGQSYEGYYVDAGKGSPLVLLVHDWDGLTDYEIKRAEMLKKLGYSVFAADLFGAGVRPTEVKDKRQHTGELYKNREKMRSILNASLKKAVSLGAKSDNALAMGYCFGGAAVLEMARSGADLKGFASFHGGLSTPEGQDYKSTKGTILVMHGTADAHIPMNQFADLATRMEQDGAAHEMVTYSGAPHAFTVFGSDRYRKDADEKSWKKFTEFLADATK